MTKQMITQDGRPAFVVIPIEEWRRIEAALEDRADAASLRAFLKNPSETFPDSVVAAILDGTHPLKALHDDRGMAQADLAKVSGTTSVYISQIERGERRAGRNLRAKLGKALRVEPDLLERDAE